MRAIHLLEVLLPPFEAICTTPQDNAETRARKAQFTLAMTVIVPAGFVWAGLYFAFGGAFAALFPFAYSVLSLINLGILWQTRHFRFFQVSELALILLLPFALQVALGGFVAGSAVVIWSLLCPLFAVMFTRSLEAIFWFLAFLVAVVAAGLLQPSLDHAGSLPDWLVWALFIMNISTVSTITFAMLVSFVHAREQLRRLEKAYLNQTVMLRQREKLATLGTLAAGVAHELNNPAAAVRRSAEQLLPSLERLARSGAALASLGALASRCEAIIGGRVGAAEHRSPLDLADQEDELADWLGEQGIERPWEVAPSLLGIGYDRGEIEKAVEGVDPASHGRAVEFMGEVATIAGLGQGIGEGARRISDIVSALRSYSYVDRGTWQTVDITEGLESTLVLLRSKLRDMRIERHYAGDLPQIEVRGNELNQVWTNIIDNAIDATGGKGVLTIRTAREGDRLVVTLEDDGPGIPAEIVDKVFDPFFTTKAPGHGTGLGLNISYNIVVRQHGGMIDVASGPDGGTRFRVALPLQRAEPQAG